MPDSFLAISEIASDHWMQERVVACATQQQHLGSIAISSDIYPWVMSNRYVWASSPDWGAAWDSALAAHPDDPAYEPGKDGAVITDGQILATVQTLGSPGGGTE